MELNKYFKLFASCIPVKGSNRSLICDLSRVAFDFIPNSLFYILTENSQLTLAEIIAQHGVEHKEVIIEYFHFMEEQEYLFFCSKDELERFPAMDMEWRSPYTVGNAIYDYSLLNREYAMSIIESLSNLGCSALQVRCFEEWKTEDLKEMAIFLENSRIKNVEIIIRYNAAINSLITELREFKHIYSIFCFAAPFEKVEEKGHCRVIYSKEETLNTKSCGMIGPSFFAVNVPTFTESQQHNTCLNRKISIDIEGNIKNCPSMVTSFGHIGTTSLAKVIEDPAFIKLWHIKKDEITKCKGCEFRHICTDCRAYLEDPNDLYAAPLKCGYNPETCEWEEWSENPLKQEAMKYYDFETLGNSELVLKTKTT